MHAVDDLSVDDAVAAQELWLGPPVGGSCFADLDELTEAWTRLRDFVMGEYAKEGRRPMAWWLLEAPGLGLRFDDLHEQSILYEAGVVVGEEKRALEQHWRHEFEQAQALPDLAARRRHLRDSDVPRSLLNRWSAARRRQARTIRKLAAPKRAQEDADA